MSKLKKAKPVRRITKGARVLPSSKATPSKPAFWDEFIGMFKNDPDFAEVKQIMAANRQKTNADPKLL